MSRIPLLDGGLVDTHVHFFDRDLPDSQGWWPYLDPDGGGMVADAEPVQPRRFTPHELMTEARRLTPLAKCVHIESAHGAADPVLESRWLADLRAASGMPHAAVVRVELDRADAEEVLEAHLRYPFVAGVRDPGKTHLLTSDPYLKRVSGLGAAGLVYELYCTFRRFGDVAAAAARCADTVIVLEHLGFPPRPASTDFASWREGLRRLAVSDNVVLKLSGLGLVARDWTMAEAAQLLEAAIDAFGADRCLFGSNFPVDKAAGSYVDAVAALASAVESLSPHERAAVLASNAERVYNI